jgi:transposase-like protein
MAKKRSRKRYEAAFKARVALAAVRGDKTLGELSSQYGVHGTLISQWKRRLLDQAPQAFEEGGAAPAADQQPLIDELHRQIGVLNVELDWLKKKAARFSG